MKYHSGDKVRIRDDLKAGQVHHTTHRDETMEVSVNVNMERLRGHVCTIDDVVLGGAVYFLDEDLHGEFWAPSMFDPVEAPSHYNIEGLKQESIEVIKAVVEHNRLGGWASALLKDTLKYLFRFGRKNGLEDLLKARKYLDWLIEEYDND